MALAALSLAAALPLSLGAPPSVVAADPASAEKAVIARFQALIPQLMAAQNIPGLSVAVVDGDRPVWVQGFGHLDGPDSPPVGPDTIFSVQSMSKLFTATAVMRAVQDGLVSLDAPITTYLPDFTVHSVFEPHPEQKITLRMLLSCTAGFTHEAPVGNNYLLDPGDFDAHVRSISDTWLRFPVGSGYAYSNLGFDLAGAVLEKVYGKPFAAVMDDVLLGPVGMAHSTFDRARIAATADRAIGHQKGMPSWRLDVPMTGAGGLYASASDLARFLSFEVGDGSIGGRSILSSALIGDQRLIPAPNAGAGSGYALGVAKTRWRAERYQDIYNHGGGGFGFLSDFWFVPSVGIGVAVLTNSSDNTLQGDLAIQILRGFVDEPGSSFGAKLATLTSQADVVDPVGNFQPPSGYPDLLSRVVLPASPDQPARWASFAGTYGIVDSGVIAPGNPPDRFLVDSGTPYFDASDDGTVVRHRLTEVQPALFIADNGETLDFRSSPPTWRSLALVSVQGGPLWWQAALLAGAVVVAVGWVVVVAAAWVLRRRRGVSVERATRPSRRVVALGVLTSVFILGGAAIVAVLPGMVDAGFLGWLPLPLVVRLALHVPLVLAVLALAVVVVALAAWRRRRWSHVERIGFTALAVAAMAVALQLGAWRLIGWGF
jgi:CubicO group peptidase (beta-lactamase class C family)